MTKGFAKPRTSGLSQLYTARAVLHEDLQPTCMHACMHACKSTYIQMCIRASLPVCLREDTRLNTYTPYSQYSLTHIHTHTHFHIIHMHIQIHVQTYVVCILGYHFVRYE